MSSGIPTPPDRSHVQTEQRNPRSARLHEMSVEQCVGLINLEDRSVATAVERAAEAIAAFIKAVEPGFIAGGRLIYVGAGTSGRLGVLDASEAPPTFCVDPGKIIGIIAGGDRSLRESSEGREDEPGGAHDALRALDLTGKDSVLAIAAGGTTPYAIGAVAFARALPARPVTGFLTCSPIAPPAAADHVIVLETGPEVLTGSTRMKAGSATKMVLNTISTTLMIRSGRVYENLMIDLRATNDKLRDRAARVISTLTGLVRERALTLLESAGGAVKVAVVMERNRIDRATAERLLHDNGDRLERVIGN